MKIKSLVVGNTQIKNNIFLAPMAGYTDYAFRSLMLELGVGLVFTELVSAKGLVYGGKGSADLLYSGNGIKNTAVQLFGSEPDFMRAACESEELKNFDIVDINMGCPVPKVYKNGEGSALLNDIFKAEKIVSACVKSGKTVTVKIRTGQKYGDDVAEDFTRMAEQSGASLVTVHGRVREAYYSGEPDYNAIYKAKRAVNIPVIANGGIFSVDDANSMIEKTGADGVMLARGTICNPFLACELLGVTPSINLKDFIIKHLTLSSERTGNRRAALEFRKFVPYYFKGKSGFKEIKSAIVTMCDSDEIISFVNKNL